MSRKRPRGIHAYRGDRGGLGWYKTKLIFFSNLCLLYYKQYGKIFRQTKFQLILLAFEYSPWRLRAYSLYGPICPKMGPRAQQRGLAHRPQIFLGSLGGPNRHNFTNWGQQFNPFIDLLSQIRMSSPLDKSLHKSERNTLLST